MARHRKEPPDRALPIGVWVDLVTHPEKNVMIVQRAASAIFLFLIVVASASVSIPAQQTRR